MNKRLWRSQIGAAFVLGGVLATAADAQDEEVFELSPFVISGSESDGYRSRNTLAGTRIKTDLKDLGAAISVITAEFMEDTGVTGIEDLLLYTTGTEIGGPNGNFSGLDFGTDSSASYTSDDAGRINPADGARVRGIAKPNFTRNYFSSDIRVDSYNTGGVTISRGANSLLFGLGSAAGVIENSVKMPQIGENKTKFSHRFGEHGSHRVTFDLTRTLIEDRLAIKVSGLNSETNYTQNPAYQNENRAYFAFNGTLFKNENIGWLGKTSVRGNLEMGKSKGTPPKNVAPTAGWDSFFEPPPNYKAYNGLGYFNTGDDPTQTFIDAWSKWKLIDAREQADGTPGYRESQTLAGDYPVYSTPYFFNPPITTIQSDGTLSLGLARDPGISGFRTWANGNQITASGIAHRPGIHVNTRPYEAGIQGGGFRTGTLDNHNIFDYRNHLITGDIDLVTNDFDAQTFFLEQSLFNGKGGIEIAIDHQDIERYSFLPFGSNDRNSVISIDTTQYLPTGELNPNAGKAFMTGSGTNEADNTEVFERNNERAIAYYELDFNDFGDGFGKVFGKHSFTALYQREDQDRRNLKSGGFIDGPNLQGTNPLAGGSRKFSGVYYLTPDSLVGKEESEVRLTQLSKSHMLQDGDSWDILFYPYTGGANGTKFPSVNNPTNHNGTIETITYKRYLYDAGVSRDTVESKAFAWQSRLFGGHIVGLVGVREDDVTKYKKVRVDPETGETVYNANGTPNTGAVLRVDNTIIPESIAARLKEVDPPGKTSTWSVVAHMPQKYIDSLPVSSLSAHYAVSDNFQPGESGVDHAGDFVNPPEGQTTEMGISIGFAEDKWNLRINKFDTKQLNKSAGSLNTAINNAKNEPRGFINSWLAEKRNNLGTSNLDKVTGLPQPDFGKNFAYMVPDGNGGTMPNLNPEIVEALDLGFTSYDHVIDTLRFNLLPQAMLDQLGWALNNDGNSYIETGPGAGDIKAIQHVDAGGYEIELVGNPTKNWRISANISKTEATPYDSGLPFSKFLGEVSDNMKANNLTNLQTAFSSIVDVRVRIEGQLNNIYNIQAQDGVPAPELREWRGNVVTNYKFSEGKFKGFSFGGAMRYQSGVGTGAELMFLPNGIAVADPSRRFQGPADTTIDGWLSYDRKIMSDKVKWKVQLNVRNLFGDEDDIVVYTNPMGVDKIFRVAPDVRSWFVTNTFSF